MNSVTKEIYCKIRNSDFYDSRYSELARFYSVQSLAAVINTDAALVGGLSDLQRKEFDGEKLATTLIKAEVGLSMNFAI